SAGNVPAATQLRFMSPVAGIDSSVTVDAAGITGGAEAETDDALRARWLARLRLPPMGGRPSDYVAWARAAHPAVTRVWVTSEYEGHVYVRFVTDNEADLI